MVRTFLALLALAPLGAPLVLAEPGRALGTSSSCQVPMQGRYAVMGMGSSLPVKGTTSPEARLLQERWLPGGAVRGEIIERVGQNRRSGSYSGRVTVVGTCLVRVERQLPWGAQVSEAVLDSKGRPLYSLDRASGTVITGRWLPMAPGACKASDLNGVVLSSQVGSNWQQNSWTPNAVVQREEWAGGNVKGIALASYNGAGETVGYTGKLQLDSGSCWGTLVERDAKGVPFNYRALVVNGRNGARGYLYLQTDPTNLTVGWLVRE